MREQEVTHFQEAFRNRASRELVRRMMIQHYAEAILEHHPDPDSLVRETIWQRTDQLCTAIFNEIGRLEGFPGSLYPLMQQLSRSHQPQSSIWFKEFNEAYEHYKHHRKLKLKMEQLAPFMQGASYADIGCGGGDLVAYLKKYYRGFSSYTGIDVMDWRSDSVREEIDFQVFDFSKPGAGSPRKYDMATCMAVLHHVGDNDESRLRFLDNVRNSLNPSGRLLIEEDVILPREEISASADYLEQVKALKMDQPLYPEYLALSGRGQEHALVLIDLLANALTVGVPDMDFPFGFKTIEGWKKLFMEAGYSVEKVQINGFVNSTFNRSSHVVYLLGRN
jgi:SAM-dependent methyltransferase